LSLSAVWVVGAIFANRNAPTPGVIIYQQGVDNSTLQHPEEPFTHITKRQSQSSHTPSHDGYPSIPFFCFVLALLCIVHRDRDHDESYPFPLMPICPSSTHFGRSQTCPWLSPWQSWAKCCQGAGHHRWIPWGTCPCVFGLAFDGSTVLCIKESCPADSTPVCTTEIGRLALKHDKLYPRWDASPPAPCLSTL